MADIEYIKNVVSSVHLVAAVDPNPDVMPVWSTTLTGLPNSNPDECVIRSITFNNAAAVDDMVYLIWSNIANDFIGSFPGGAISTTTPNTRIRLNSPLPNQLQFRLYVPEPAGELPVVVDVEVIGDIVINMDFIKYKGVPPHA